MVIATTPEELVEKYRASQSLPIEKSNVKLAKPRATSTWSGFESIFATQGITIETLFKDRGVSNALLYKNVFNQVAIVRQSIILLADFAVSQGSETVAKPLHPADAADYSIVKQKVDDINTKINLDWVLKVGEINRRVYGRAGFEKVRDENGFIERMIPLDPSVLVPKVVDFDLVRLNYPKVIDDDGVAGYDPKNVFYLTNLDMTNTYLGVSDIDPIKDSLETRKNLELDLRESAEKLWAPTLLAAMETAGMTDLEEKKAFEDFVASVKPGRSVVHNKSVETETISLTPDLQSLTVAMGRIDEDIIGNFSIPKAMLAREKCFAGETEFIDSSTGELIEFKSLKQPIETYTYNEDTKKFEQTRDIVSVFAQDNEKLIIKITTKKGYSIRVSDDHPILTKKGWVRAANITLKDSIAVVSKINLPEVIDLNHDLAFLLGIIISEGSIFMTKVPNGKPFLRFAITNFDMNLLDEISACIPVKHSKSVSQKGEGKIIINGMYADQLMKMYKDKGIDLPIGVHARQKRLPSRIYGLTLEAKKEFIKGYMAGDVSITRAVSGYSWKVNFASASYKLLSDIRWLLSGFGCIATISKTNTTFNLELYSYWAHELLSQLGNFLWRNNWQACLNETGDCATQEDLDGDICWLPVKSVEVGDYETVYDIEMPNHHNIITNQVICARTMNRATLEYSLKALYDGPIKGIQRYLKREIERQIYQDIIETYDNVNNTSFAKKVRISHKFNPTPIYDVDLLRILGQYFQLGLVDERMIYDIIGWDPARIPKKVEQSSPFVQSIFEVSSPTSSPKTSNVIHVTSGRPKKVI